MLIGDCATSDTSHSTDYSRVIPFHTGLTRHMWNLSLLLATACLVVLCVSPHSVSSLSNGLARLPPMGWSTWNTFRCDYTESDLRGVAATLVSSGMAAAGYTSLNIDDCWEAEERTANGQLTYNTTKFPSGLKAFGDYVHSLNLTFGLYTSSGPYTCQEYPGSWQHEADDAKQFAAWGVDYLKLDCCYQFNTSDRRVAYEAMSAALLRTGRPILFSCDTDELILHENNEEYPAQWAPYICNIARINWDIWDSWTSTMEILTAATNLAYASGPGYWNDLDILTVGMGAQTMDEYISHFQLWCIASSPLIAGNDIRTMSDEPDFRPLPLHGVVLLNRLSTAQDVLVDFDDLFDNKLSPHVDRPPFEAEVSDVWTGQQLGSYTSSFTAKAVRGHASRMISIRCTNC